jgi:hypothetical protein
MAFVYMIPICIEPICKMSMVSEKIYNLVYNIQKQNSSATLSNALIELDITNTIKILEKMISELNIDNMTETLKLCLDSLRECMDTIEKEFIRIYEKVNYNNSLWGFSSFRSYKFTSSIERLRNLKKQLEERKKLFFDILSKNNLLKIKREETFSEDNSFVYIDDIR